MSQQFIATVCVRLKANEPKYLQANENKGKPDWNLEDNPLDNQ